MKTYTQQEKHALLEQLAASGKSTPEFASEHGLKAQNLYNWRSCERQRARTAAKRNGLPATQAQTKVKQQQRPSPLFCPCCGANLLEEYTKLLMKLRALQNVKL